MRFPPAEVEQIESVLGARLGHVVDDSNRERVLEAIASRVAKTRHVGAVGYLATLDRTELRALAGELVVGESYFFRGRDHWDAIREVVLPDLLARNADTRRLSILSAGCASGEEPYTMAMILADALPSGWTVELVGADVNPQFLARAREGRYTAWALRETPPDVRARWFHSTGTEHVLDASIRSKVSFVEHNLHDAELLGPFDLVMCRNVLIYFTTDACIRLVARFANELRPGGYLFLGHAESLRDLSTAYELCHTHETFYYRLPAEPIAAASPAPSADWFAIAQRSADRIAELAGRAPVAAAAESPDALLANAAVMLDRGDVATAEASCRRLVALDSLHAGGHFLLATCLEARGAIDEAIDAAQTAAYLDAGFAMPHLMLGRLARRRGDTATARRELGVALVAIEREDATRIGMFGGGFTRELLVQLCRTELEAVR